MKPSKNVHQGSRVFIAGLRFFEIVYLPESGQIVSRIEPGDFLPPVEEDRRPDVSFLEDEEENGDLE